MIKKDKNTLRTQSSNCLKLNPELLFEKSWEAELLPGALGRLFP
jgi:hypothetical protein